MCYIAAPHQQLLNNYWLRNLTFKIPTIQFSYYQSVNTNQDAYYYKMHNSSPHYPGLSTAVYV